MQWFIRRIQVYDGANNVGAERIDAIAVGKHQLVIHGGDDAAAKLMTAVLDCDRGAILTPAPDALRPAGVPVEHMKDATAFIAEMERARA